jgi:hypothetical protein
LFQRDFCPVLLKGLLFPYRLFSNDIGMVQQQGKVLVLVHVVKSGIDDWIFRENIFFGLRVPCDMENLMTWRIWWTGEFGDMEIACDSSSNALVTHPCAVPSGSCETRSNLLSVRCRNDTQLWNSFLMFCGPSFQSGQGK